MKRLLPAVLVTLVLCVPAEAATTVARDGELTLHAQERGDRVCMTLRRERRYQGQRCGRIPRSPHRPLMIFPDAFTNAYAAAVAPSVHSAEAETRDGRREQHRVSAPRGFTARFVLIAATPAPVFVRFHGADGRLLAVDAGLAGYITFDNETQVFGDEEAGVRAHTESLLAPAPGDPGRLITVACASVDTRSGGRGFCDVDTGDGLGIGGECRRPDLAGGIVSPGVAAVRLTLGSGAQVTLEPRSLPAPFGLRRAIAAELPAGEAIREAAALDATGAVVARAVVGTAPSGQPCVGEDQGDDGFLGPLVPVAPPAGAVAVAAAGGQSLVAADQGERLCVAFGALRPRLCPPPPVDSDRPRLRLRDGVVGGVLSRDAARVTLRRDRGPDVSVPTTPGEAYAGRWAGHVRFFAAEVGQGRRVTRAVIRDAAGDIIGISERGIAPPRPVRRTVLAERGGRGVQLVRRAGEQPCLTAFPADGPPAPSYCTDLDPGTPIDGPYLPYSAAVLVPCSPGAPIAYGRMPDEFAPPRVVLAGGRAVRARRITLRGEDGWVAFLPGAEVRGVRAGRRRVRLALPPASAQCGYRVTRRL